MTDTEFAVTALISMVDMHLGWCYKCLRLAENNSSVWGEVSDSLSCVTSSIVGTD